MPYESGTNFQLSSVSATRKVMVRVLATLFSALLLLIVAIVVAGSVIVYRYGKDLPDIRQLATYEPQ